MSSIGTQIHICTNTRTLGQRLTRECLSIASIEFCLASRRVLVHSQGAETEEKKKPNNLAFSTVYIYSVCGSVPEVIGKHAHQHTRTLFTVSCLLPRRHPLARRRRIRCRMNRDRASLQQTCHFIAMIFGGFGLCVCVCV